MKAIIIGTPGKGKTTLMKKLMSEYNRTHQETSKIQHTKDYEGVHIISLGKIRSALGIHTPHKGYETEVSDKDIPILISVLTMVLDTMDNFIVEGYGLCPEDALTLGEKYNCPVILLCHKNTTAEEDYELVRKYDDKDKWTNRRDDNYLKTLFKFYKKVENNWIKRMPDYLTFNTEKEFDKVINEAFEYIIKLNDTDKTPKKLSAFGELVSYMKEHGEIE